MNSAVDVVADDVDAAPIPQGMTAVTAPVSGVIWTTDVEIGKAVAATDTVAIDGAMKMETAVNSPIAGTVVQVRVGPGDSINAGDVIAVIEPDEHSQNLETR